MEGKILIGTVGCRAFCKFQPFVPILHIRGHAGQVGWVSYEPIISVPNFRHLAGMKSSGLLTQKEHETCKC